MVLRPQTHLQMIQRQRHLQTTQKLLQMMQQRLPQMTQQQVVDAIVEIVEGVYGKR